MDERHYMYVVECADGSWYTGYAADVERRVAAHNAGRGAKYTRARLPVRLVASAAFATKHEAMSAEARFKRVSRARKEALVAAGAGSSETFARVLNRAFGGTLAAGAGVQLPGAIARRAQLPGATAH